MSVMPVGYIMQLRQNHICIEIIFAHSKMTYSPDTVIASFPGKEVHDL